MFLQRTNPLYWVNTVVFIKYPQTSSNIIKYPEISWNIIEISWNTCALVHAHGPHHFIRHCCHHPAGCGGLGFLCVGSLEKLAYHCDGNWYGCIWRRSIFMCWFFTYHIIHLRHIYIYNVLVIVWVNGGKYTMLIMLSSQEWGPEV